MKIINKKDDVITFKYFLNNPIGQDAQAMHYNLIRQEYTRKYNELMKRKKIEIAGVYKIQQSYFLHLLIPSESSRDNNYDVVIEFYDEKNNLKYEPTINKYSVRFFSNCPSFVFTYAYAYKSNNLLINELGNKFNDLVLSQEPKIKNPSQITNIDKSLFFALLFLYNNLHYQYKSVYESTRFDMSKDFSELYNKIRNSDEILLEIEKAKIKEKKNKEEERKNNEISVKNKIKKETRLARKHEKSESSVRKIGATNTSLNKSSVRTIKPTKTSLSGKQNVKSKRRKPKSKI